MKKIVIHNGFHPEQQREYNGEHIYKVVSTKEVNGIMRYFLEHGAVIKHLGNDKYQPDWRTESERWGRVEEVEYDDAGNIISSQDLGFMILRVDRSRGLL